MDQKTEIFKRILPAYQDKIYRLCYSYVGNSEDCKDLYQNILVKIWRNIDSLKDDTAISTWIYRISVNASIDYVRKISFERQYSSDKEIKESDVPETTIDVEGEFLKNEGIHLLYRAIKKLTFLEQTLVSLYLEDVKYKEIANILGISEKNVGVKLTRIKKKLSNILNSIEK
jgi:RNA polymerase sigma-70 factor (ECF subfamily)